MQLALRAVINANAILYGVMVRTGCQWQWRYLPNLPIEYPNYNYNSVYCH